MKQGKLFSSVLNYLIGELGCGLTVKSDFYNINPDATNPDNLAYTYSEQNFHHMTLHQKSDVKRPDATNPATANAYGIRTEDLLNDLKKLHNVDWRIQDNGTTFRIEHLSYFEASTGQDLSSVNIKEEYEFDKENSQRVEQFKFMDELASDYFRGSNIEYNCGEGVKDIKLSIISTDVVTIQNTASDQAISDKGFVLISNELQDGSYVIIDENKPQSWTDLHENLFRHGRAYPTGKINGVDMSFISSVYRKKAVPFTHELCCDDAFSEDDLITTELGDGQIITAEYDLKRNKMTYELAYQ